MKHGDPHRGRPMAVLAALASAMLLAASAAQGSEGRWVGVAEIPGSPVAVVLELLPEGDAWRGHLTLPERGVRGLAVQARRVTAGALVVRAEALGGVEIELSPAATAGEWRGRWRQAGHEAPLRLQADGAATALPAPPESALPAALHGTWRGRYDVGFGERQVTLRVGPDGRAAMTVVGRRTTEVAFDRAVQSGNFVFLGAAAFGIRIEMPLAAASGPTLNARLLQGPFESTLLLAREAGVAR